MSFTPEAMKNAHSPAARRKAVETMRRNRVAMFRKREPLHTIRSPQERSALIAKIDALRASGMSVEDASKKIGLHRSAYNKWKATPHLLAAKPNGKTDTIDVSTLPSRPGKRKKYGTRRMFTPQERAQLVARSDALVASGMQKRLAAKAVGVHDTQIRQWKKGLKKKGRAQLNGHAHLGNDAVQLSVTIAGQPHAITLDEAVAIYSGLAPIVSAIKQ